jgi:hypothetical protein
MPWSQGADPRPADDITADLPACTRCTWAMRGDGWYLKFVCRACPDHGGRVPLVEIPEKPSGWPSLYRNRIKRGLAEGAG